MSVPATVYVTSTDEHGEDHESKIKMMAMRSRGLYDPWQS